MRIAAGLLGLGVLAAVALAARGPLEVPAAPRGEALLSIFAVGDTGKAPRPLGRNAFLSVAQAIEASDRARPADALVLLGDNFYPKGLRSEELVERVRANLVAPYCRFVDLSGPRAPEVADACDASPDARHIIPIFAVLGNHDYGSEESPRLQHEVVPTFTPNFHLSPGTAEARELGAGVSLVLWDSNDWDGGEDALVEALRAARGPWRILASHHPPLTGSHADRVRRAMGRAGVPVHLHIAGHEHNLQLARLADGLPSLAAIAGGGSSARASRYGVLGDEAFHRVHTGFMRVDLMRDDERDERLVVSLMSARRYPVLFWQRGELLARMSVDREGRVHEEPVYGTDG